MCKRSIKKIIFFTFLLVSILCFRGYVFAEDLSPTSTPTPDTSSQTKDLQNKINDLQNKINDLKGQEQSLSSQISVMDNQIKLAEYQIASTEEQITNITLDIDTTTKKISGLENSLSGLVEVLLTRMIATYQVGTIQPLEILLTSTDASDFLSRLNYLRLAQAHDKQLIYQTQQAKVDYANQKQIFEDKKKKIESLKIQLLAYNKQLDSEKKAKQDLLSQTQGSEANYQSILAQTKAQLAGFKSFVTSQGGASLLSNQTSCDDWGCYYNQRDSQWGANSLNGTGYTLADSGCLVTSVAMVYTHFGHKDVTPQSINSNSGNFAGIPAALLRYSVNANGISSQRVNASIDSELASGTPIIVGISYDGGPLADHFLVLVSGSNGNYMMNDPFTAGAHNVPFTSHYSVSSIVQINKVIF